MSANGLVLTLSGTNLMGVLNYGAYSVTMGGITTTNVTSTATTITATFTTAFSPQSYAVVALFKKSRSQCDTSYQATIDVTVGAVGPQGPIGMTGAPGAPGATGAPGAPGAPGPTTIAAVCSTLFPSSSTAFCAASLGFYKMVFVTVGSYDGNLGGTAGAAAICQTDADAAGLPGKYKAWLSTTLTYGGDAALQDEPLNTFNHSTVPYYEPDGTTEIASNWSNFASACSAIAALGAPIAASYGPEQPTTEPIQTVLTGTA